MQVFLSDQTFINPHRLNTGDGCDERGFRVVVAENDAGKQHLQLTIGLDGVVEWPSWLPIDTTPKPWPKWEEAPDV